MNPAIATGGEYCHSRLCGRTGGPTLLAQGWLCGREALIAGAFLEEPWRSWRSSETDPHGATAQGGVQAVAVAPAQVRAGGCLV